MARPDQVDELFADNATFKNYEVKNILGEGGMGKVYRVFHRDWNIDLAVKCARQEVLTDDKGKENFVREAETWVDLGLHPNIASCYYVRTIANNPLVFIEYIEGGSLHDWIVTRNLYEGGPEQALERILDVAIQFAWGLSYAHAQGVVHQDVKPRNVMITRSGIVKVTDFGLARAFAKASSASVTSAPGHSIIVPGAGLMTREYASPEQAKGEALTRKTDIWSWGVSLLEMFTGEVTWRTGVAAAEALALYLDNGTVHEQTPRMPDDILTLLRWCLQKTPADRPSSLDEAADALIVTYHKCTGLDYRRKKAEKADSLADDLNNRALSLFDLGKQNEAQLLWQEAQQLQPHHLDSVYNLGLIRWRSGIINDTALCQEIINAASSYKEDWAGEYFLGLIHMERGDEANALKALNEVPDFSPSWNEAQAAIQTVCNGIPQARRRHRVFEGHKKNITSCGFSSNEKHGLSGSFDKTVRLWDLSTGRCMTFEGHKEHVLCVCFSKDGRYAFSGSGEFANQPFQSLLHRADYSIRIWDIYTDQRVATLSHPLEFGMVTSIDVSQDGRLAVSGSVKGALLWDLKEKRCLGLFRRRFSEDIDLVRELEEKHAPLTDPVSSVCLSRDGRYILAGHGARYRPHFFRTEQAMIFSYQVGNHLSLWEASSGRLVRAFEGHTESVNSVRLSADGNNALSASADGTLKWWDVETGKCLRTIEMNTGAGEVCISQDSRWAASCSGSNVALYEVETGRCLCTIDTQYAQDPEADSVSLSSTGRYLLCGGSGGILQLWEVSLDCPEPYVAPFALCRVQSSEKLLGPQRIFKREMELAHKAMNHGDMMAAAQHIEEGRTQVGYHRSAEAAELWGQLYLHFPRKRFRDGWEAATFKLHGQETTAICLSRDGRHALSGDAGSEFNLYYPEHNPLGGIIKLWETATGRCLKTFTGHEKRITSLSMSDDERVAISGSWDHTARLWDMTTGECLQVLTGHKTSVNAVCLSPDGVYAARGSDDNTITIWELNSDNVFTLKNKRQGYSWGVDALCFSQDGQYLLSGDTVGITLWDLETGRPIKSYDDSLVKQLYLTTDGRVIISGSYSKIRLFDVATGRCLREIGKGDEAFGSVAVTGDWRYAISNCGTSVSLWELETGQRLRTFEGMKGAVSISLDGRFVVSSASKLFLDWELDCRQPDDWDERARIYLEAFLSRHTPCSSKQSNGMAFARLGTPNWTEEDFSGLLFTMGCAGFGWIKPERALRELQQMCKTWKCPPSLPRSEEHLPRIINPTEFVIESAEPKARIDTAEATAEPKTPDGKQSKENQILYDKGRRCYGSKDWNGAVKYLGKLIEAAPHYGDAAKLHSEATRKQLRMLNGLNVDFETFSRRFGVIGVLAALTGCYYLYLVWSNYFEVSLTSVVAFLFGVIAIVRTGYWCGVAIGGGYVLLLTKIPSRLGGWVLTEIIGLSAGWGLATIILGEQWAIMGAVLGAFIIGAMIFFSKD